MVRGLLFLLFCAVVLLLIAVCIFLIVRGIYAVYRQLRREDLLDARTLRDDESGYTRL